MTDGFIMTNNAAEREVRAVAVVPRIGPSLGG